MAYIQGEGLIPLLHKHGLLRTQSCFLQCDVIVQVSESSTGKVGDKFKAFIGEPFRLNMSHQCLQKTKIIFHTSDHYYVQLNTEKYNQHKFRRMPTMSLALADSAICSLWPSGYRSIKRAFGPANKVILVMCIKNKNTHFSFKLRQSNIVYHCRLDLLCWCQQVLRAGVI